MPEIPQNGFVPIEEDAATGTVEEIYTGMKRDLQMPTIPNMPKVIANSPAMLKIHMELVRGAMQDLTLPMSLTSMIQYLVADRADCEYCAAGNELMCRTLGVDDETLAALAKELGEVNPERLRIIMEFALQVAKDPQKLTRKDYDLVREQGVTEEELMEIIFVASYAVYNDTMADALKVEVEESVKQALSR